MVDEERPPTLAEKIIAFFETRGGFDHWWDDIDSDVQEEIVDELTELLEKEIVR